ncbi:hypothetical protein ACU42Y_09885 [Proteus mirabilis]
MGLQGSQSPLPGYYLDEFAWEDAQQIEGISASRYLQSSSDSVTLSDLAQISLLHLL